MAFYNAMSLRHLALLGVAAFIGCGKGPETGFSTTRNQDVAASAAEETAGDAAILADLTQAVRKFAAEQKRAPKTLEEVAAHGYITAKPAAPAGKQFAISKNLEVYLAGE